jgi:predicted type IV restriction endonuclease
MTLKEHIDDIREGLDKGVFIGEAAVSQGIVLRLLNVLTWPTYNTQVIIPEYSVEGRRVDYALCHPSSKPVVFIEVKQVGNIEGAERQLFEYAFHEGVPIAILTDGREWRFFHPTAQGDYRERKVHEMDLTEDDSEKKC